MCPPLVLFGLYSFLVLAAIISIEESKVCSLQFIFIIFILFYIFFLFLNNKCKIICKFHSKSCFFCLFFSVLEKKIWLNASHVMGFVFRLDIILLFYGDEFQMQHLSQYLTCIRQMQQNYI